MSPDDTAPWMMSLGEESKAVGRTGMMLYVNTPPGVVVTGWPGSVTEIVIGPASPKSLAVRRMRAPIDGGLVTVAVGIGNRTLIWPGKTGFWTLVASVIVMSEAEEIFGASR